MAIHRLILEDVEHLPKVQRRLLAWYFRGHADPSWEISSTFERALERSDFKKDDLPMLEAEILREFRRRAHHYLDHLPCPSAWIEWQSLIRHFGGPTRIVDFTRSMSVAAFFAVENTKGDAAVWAVNPFFLRNEFSLLSEGQQTSDAENRDQDIVTVAFSDAINSSRSFPEGVTVLEPFELNERMTVQQGRFIAPNVLGVSFVLQLERTLGESLEEMTDISLEDLLEFQVDSNGRRSFEPRLVKVIIPANKVRQFRNYLRLNNIDAATLFPGLDGFARSLYGRL